LANGVVRAVFTFGVAPGVQLADAALREPRYINVNTALDRTKRSAGDMVTNDEAIVCPCFPPGESQQRARRFSPLSR